MTNTEMVEAVYWSARNLGVVAGEVRFGLKYDGGEGARLWKSSHALILEYAEHVVSGMEELRDGLSLEDYTNARVTEDSDYWRLMTPLLWLYEGIGALSLAVKIVALNLPGHSKALDRAATAKHGIEEMRQWLDELERELDNG